MVTPHDPPQPFCQYSCAVLCPKMRSPRIRIQRYLRCVLHFIYNQILVLDSELVELLKMCNLNRHSFSFLHTIRANSFSTNNQPDYINMERNLHTSSGFQGT